MSIIGANVITEGCGVREGGDHGEFLIPESCLGGGAVVIMSPSVIPESCPGVA
jgi:hypothetical protein